MPFLLSLRLRAAASLCLGAAASLYPGAALAQAPDQGPAASAPPNSGLAVEIGGEPMTAAHDIAENLAASREFTKFSSLVAAAGLMELFAGSGPFTLFVPLDKALEAAPEAIAGIAADPAPDPQGAALARRFILHHALAGKFSIAALLAAIRAGGGEARLATLAGDEARLRQNGLHIEISDAQGGAGVLVISNVAQKNGVIHVIDGPLAVRP